MGKCIRKKQKKQKENIKHIPLGLLSQTKRWFKER